jgi:N-methylhydantoinase B
LNCIVDPRNERHLANDPIVITSHLPVEALEIEYPLTVLCHELVDDSDGGGRFRRVYRAEADCYLRIDGPRLMTLLWALDGGEPGGCCTFLFGGGVEPFVAVSGALRAGKTVEIITPSADGYGQPSARASTAISRALADMNANRNPAS